MSIGKVQCVMSVHFRIVRCHQIKERHHTWLSLVKILTELKKVFSLKWRNTPWEAFSWWGGECPADPAIRSFVGCSIAVTPGQEGIVLGVKQRTQDFWSQQKQACIACQTYLEELSRRSQCLYQDLGFWFKQWIIWLRGWIRSHLLVNNSNYF